MPECSMLKIVYTEYPDGTWKQKGMFKIPICPDGGSPSDFFKIENINIHVDNICSDYSDKLISESIVPIVFKSEDSPIFTSIGTAFFISCSGILVTATHVLSDIINHNVNNFDDSNLKICGIDLGIMVPLQDSKEDGVCTFLPIKSTGLMAEVYKDPMLVQPDEIKISTDIAFCKVASKSEATPYQPLAVDQNVFGKIRTFGTHGLLVIGYGELEGEFELSHDKEKSTSRKNSPFKLHCSIGNFVHFYEHNFDGKDAPTPGPCFSISAKILAGMSGSPIFDAESGLVIGVASRGAENTFGPENFGYGSILKPSLELPIPDFDGKSILDLIEDSRHGIPKFNIVDE